MRFVRFLGAALLAGLVPSVAGAAQNDAPAAQTPPAQTPSAQTNVRTEIERILNADSRSGSEQSPRDVVDSITAIPRGSAPEDFWSAYQTHVQAWQQYADLADALQNQRLESAFAENAEELAAAETAIDTTFGEVERIARRYGARLPAPPIDPTSIA